MRIRLIWVGKTKQRHVSEGAGLYLGKIRPFAEVELVEIRERKGLPVAASLEREGKDLLKAAEGFVLFDERGREMGSLEFADFLKERARVDFVLGGPYGVSDEVRAAAGDALSLSRMTLNHELARLVALEQIYRALMINSGRGYHH